ncbi:putative beta-glucosidase K [Colletotrichum sp. SAR11_240]|nr:putative beta-glucosidase K [Colletotrichum sp. SAR11_240]
MLDTEKQGRNFDPSNVPVTAPQDAKAYAHEKLKQMTLEEKILLLTGEDLWRTNPIPRLGISRIKTSDGPTGVRGGIFVDGVTAASLPSGVSLAATWDRQVIEDVSQVLIAEAKSKGVDVLLGPTVCIPRTPLGGRNFEAYSEDPFLTGKLAAQYINTIQAAGIGACVKHYAANDQENRRFFIDEKIPERALREIHLQPFQIAVRDSNPWSIMTAYNKVNGDFCSANHYLIRDILRGEWGWDGLVMSDWFGTNSVVPSLTAGLDLEMPGPVRRRGKHLLEAHRQGLVDSSFIDASASRVLELVHKTGKSKIPDWKEGPEQAVDLPEHRSILRRAGAEGIVLLKNEGDILPLKDLDGKTIAFIGPNANSCGPGKLILDGKVVINIERRWWSPKSSLFMSYGSPEERVEVELKAGQSYELVLESISREPKPYNMTYTGMLEREEVQDGGRVGFLENPGDLDALLQDAVDLASRSDIAVVVVGKDHEWETETSDMVSMDLPGQSNELVRAVVRANPRTIVINQTGSPITMPWANEVPAIVQAWYQGQEQGNCIADILLGTTNPCGKLPITFPRRIEDTPSFDNYPGENDVVHYGENIYLGYRFYDHRKIEPLFPFGHGLSYTTFAYSNIRLSSDSLAVDEKIEVHVDVTNTGDVDGKEVVQFYVSPVSKPRLGRPLRELKGWDKVFVRPGETATARATLDRVSISYWDDSVQKWVIEGNAVFMVSAAKDSRDNGLVAEFHSKVAAHWVH